MGVAFFAPADVCLSGQLSSSRQSDAGSTTRSPSCGSASAPEAVGWRVEAPRNTACTAGRQSVHSLGVALEAQSGLCRTKRERRTLLARARLIGVAGLLLVPFHVLLSQTGRTTGFAATASESLGQRSVSWLGGLQHRTLPTALRAAADAGDAEALSMPRNASSWSSRRKSSLASAINSPGLWTNRREEDPSGGTSRSKSGTGQNGFFSGDAIIRCAERGEPRRAAEWLEKLLQQGFPLAQEAAGCFQALANSFARQADGKEAAKWIERSVDAGFLPKVATFREVLTALSAGGDADATAKLLEQMRSAGLAPDVGCCNAVLRGLGASSPPEAVRWLEQAMPELGVEPDPETFATLAEAFARAGDDQQAASWVDRVAQAEAGTSPGGDSAWDGLLGSLRGVCLERRDLAQLRFWLSRDDMAILRRSRAIASALLQAEEDPEEMEMWIARMQLDGLELDRACFTAVVDAWVQKEAMGRALVWIDRMLAAGYTPSRKASTAVLGSLTPKEGVEFLEGIVSPLSSSSGEADLAAPTSASDSGPSSSSKDGQFSGWLASSGGEAVAELASKRRDYQAAAEVLEQLEVAGLADAAAYNAVITGFATKGNAQEAARWFDRMTSAKLSPDVKTCSALVDARVKKGDVNGAAKLLLKLQTAGEELDCFAYTSVISGFAEQGDMAAAHLWLQRLVESSLGLDEAVFNAVIKGFVRKRDLVAAVNCLQQMSEAGLAPNVISYTTLLSAFAERGDELEVERWLHAMQAAGVTPTTVTCNAIVGGFASHGNMTLAADWLRRMKGAKFKPDSITYNRLISGCASRGDADGASRWLGRMRTARLKPDEVSFNSAIHACAK
ncbi:unnamed protein product, partial [Polarella glacialis]